MESYDVIIIGGGCSGYGCGVYSGRFGLKTLIITEEKGGLITSTHIVENYPGFISLSGQELADKLEAHAKANNAKIINDTVVDAKKNEKEFIVKTNKEEYKTKTIVLSTGTLRKKLNAPGEKELTNKGVSYCATCDGPLFKDKIVCVVGGGDSAAKESLLLSQYAKKVYVIARHQLKAEPINSERVKNNNKIEVIENNSIEKIEGDKFVERVVLKNRYNNSKILELQAVFIEIGHLPRNELAKKLNVSLNEKGEIKIDRLSRTNIEGVYAAGDIVDDEWKQAITGVAEGTIAAYSAYEYISKNFDKNFDKEVENE